MKDRTEYFRQYGKAHRKQLRKNEIRYEQKHKEQKAVKTRIWLKSHADLINARRRAKYATDPQMREDYKELARRWAKDNRIRKNETQRARNQAIRKEVIAAYGSKCSCPGCDVNYEEFMTIDHINGRSNVAHRKNLAGDKLYWWLKKNGFPKEDFRLMCFNCNACRGFHGYCPHERERQHRMAAD
jgi:predicted restriction endonuclease